MKNTKLVYVVVGLLIPIIGIPLMYYALYSHITGKDPLKLEINI